MFTVLHKSFTCFFTNNGTSPHRISCSVYLRHFPNSKLKVGELCASPVIFDLLLHKHQFSPQLASKVASALNRVEDPEKSDAILSFLKESGFSNTQLEKILNYKPEYLTASLEYCIKPKIRVFQDLGFCFDDIALIISSSPMILHLNLNTRVIPSFSTLKSLMGTNESVAKLCWRSPWILTRDLEKTLIPNIEFLKSCGTPMERILDLLYMDPRCLLVKPGMIRKSVRMTEEMGISRDSNMFIYAVRVLSLQCGKSWELKMQALQSCGFSQTDLVAMFMKAPLVFTVSAERLIRAKDVILATGKYDMSCILNHPASLAYSIEKRYKPRFKMLEILERKNLITNWPNLATVSSTSDDKFFGKFGDLI